jgi:aldehyde:ferredoxin oxidoreductase
MDGKAGVSALFQDFANSLELLVVCLYMHFNGMTMTDTMDAFNAVTGFGWETKDLFQVGERVFNLQRLINLRDGKGASEDRLPKRLFQAGSDGGRAGQAPVDFEAGLREYYHLRGWSQEGVPTPEKLQELGIE